MRAIYFAHLDEQHVRCTTDTVWKKLQKRQLAFALN